MQREQKMPLNDPYTVIVRVSPGDPLGDAMNRIRTWLDREKVQTATFTTASDAKGYTFTIGFKNIGDAGHFRQQFAGVTARQRYGARAEGSQSNINAALAGRDGAALGAPLKR
jgi:hypothetical protein